MKNIVDDGSCRVIKVEMPIRSRICRWCGKSEREYSDFVPFNWECPECLEALKRLILKERANNEQVEKGR